MGLTLQLVGAYWHGHTETHCMSLSQETFDTYLTVYLEGLGERTERTQAEAMERVTRLSYWAYARYDPHIHFMRLPGCVVVENESKSV